MSNSEDVFCKDTSNVNNETVRVYMLSSITVDDKQLNAKNCYDLDAQLAKKLIKDSLACLSRNKRFCCNKMLKIKYHEES